MKREIRGTCKWCGRADVKRPAIYWHRECFEEYALHTRLDAQYRFLVARDGERCANCGDTPERWHSDRAIVLGFALWPHQLDQARWADAGDMWVHAARNWQEAREIEPGLGGHMRIWRVKDLQVDHVIPLWSVAHLPDDERRPYFGPENLWLLCSRCHKIKSRWEAADRADLRRRSKPNE